MDLNIFQTIPENLSNLLKKTTNNSGSGEREGSDSGHSSGEPGEQSDMEVLPVKNDPEDKEKVSLSVTE